MAAHRHHTSAHHGARRDGRARPTRPQTAQRRLRRSYERCAPPDAKRRSSTMAGRLILINIHRTLTVGNADPGTRRASPGRRDDGRGAHLAIVDLGASGRASAPNTRPIAIFDTARDVKAVEAFRKKIFKFPSVQLGSSWPPPRNTNIQRQDTSATNMRVDIPAIKSFKRAGSGTFGGATTLDDDNNNETAEKKSVCALLR